MTAFPLRRGGASVPARRAVVLFAHDREEDLLERRLLLDVFDGRRGQQPLEFGERAVDDDPAAVQDGDPIGELLRLIEVLRGQQHRGAAVGELLDRLPHLDPRLRIQAGRGFVEEHHRRAADQAHRDVEPAAHAAGVGARSPTSGIRQREAGEQVVRDPSRILQVPQPRDEHQVLPPGEDLVDGRELPGQADRFAHGLRLGDDVESRDARGARIRLQQGGEDADHGRLAGAVRPEQGEDAARGDVEVDALEHVQVLERLLQSAHADRSIRDGHRSPSVLLRPWMVSVRRARSLSIQRLPA
jgi:hypothetical protein